MLVVTAYSGNRHSQTIGGVFEKQVGNTCFFEKLMVRPVQREKKCSGSPWKKFMNAERERTLSWCE